MKDFFNSARKDDGFKDLKKAKLYKMRGREVQSNLDVFFNTLKALKKSKEQNDYINQLCSEYKKHEKKEIEKFMNLSPEDILKFLVYVQMNQLHNLKPYYLNYKNLETYYL